MRVKESQRVYKSYDDVAHRVAKWWGKVLFAKERIRKYPYENNVPFVASGYYSEEVVNKFVATLTEIIAEDLRKNEEIYLSTDYQLCKKLSVAMAVATGEEQFCLGAYWYPYKAYISVSSCEVRGSLNRYEGDDFRVRYRLE